MKLSILKTGFSAILACTLSTVAAQPMRAEPSVDPNRSDQHVQIEALTVQERMALLTQAHKRVAELPHSQELIHGTIFPEIRNGRSHVAPNFPQRSNSTETDKKNLEQWLVNSPKELAAYIDYVERRVEHYRALIHN